MSSLASSKWIGLNIERQGCDIVCSACWCDSEEMKVAVLFVVPARGGWPFQVAKWLVDYWSVMLGEPVPVGGVFVCFRQLSELLKNDLGVCSINVEPVEIEGVAKAIRRAVVDEFGGQSIMVLLNFLVTNLRDEVASPILADCPFLLKVRYD